MAGPDWRGMTTRDSVPWPYRVWRWGQRVDVHDGRGRLYRVAQEYVGRPYPGLDEIRRLALAGDVFQQNLLVARDEMMDMGVIDDEGRVVQQYDD